MKETPPGQFSFGAMPWISINTENFIIRGSNLERHKPSFLHLCQFQWRNQSLDEARRVSSLSVSHQDRKKWVRANYVLSNVFALGWSEIPIKCKYLCFGLYKIQAPDPASQNPWCHKHLYIVCCAQWIIKKRRSLIQFWLLISFKNA